MDQPGIVAKVSLTGNLFLPSPSSRLITWPRETGSPVPSRASPLIIHTQAESGTYSRSYRFPRRSPSIRQQSCQSQVDQVTQLRGEGVHCRDSSGDLKVVRVRDLSIQETRLVHIYAPLFPTATIGTVDICDIDSVGGVISNIRLPECKPETFVCTL